MVKTRHRSFAWHLVAASIILLGFALRVHNLSARSLWFDEAMEYWVASASLPGLLATVKMAIQDPPLYSFLLHFWMKVGQNEFGLRFMSLSFSIIGMLGIMTLGKLSSGKAVGLIAVLLVAFSPPDIRFAQEVGQYALMACALSWNLVFLYLALTRNLWRWWILWGVSALVGVYSYYGTVIIMVATASVGFVYCLAAKKRDVLLKQAVAGSICGVFVLPLVLGWLPAQLFRGPTTKAFQVSVNPYVVELLRFLRQSKDLATYQLMGHQTYGWPWPAVPEPMVWIPFLVALVPGVIKLKSVYISVWFILCYLAYYFAGRFGAYPFGGRHSLILLPLLVVTIAAGVFSIRRFNLVVGAAVLGAILSVCVLAPSEPQEDLRTIARFWLANRELDQATYVYYGAVPGFRYQLNLADGTPGTVPPTWYVDCWRGAPASYCSQDGIFYGRWIRSLTPDQKRVSILQTTGSAPDRMWMIFSHVHPHEDQEILVAFEQDYKLVLSQQAVNASAYLLERR